MTRREAEAQADTAHGRYVTEVLTRHVPILTHNHDRMLSCECQVDLPPAERARFDRDPDGNVRKDGADRVAWARHVTIALAEEHAL